MEIIRINFHLDKAHKCEKNLHLNLINNGISLRDFIHLSDVDIYKKFLNNQYDPGIYDIGTEKGYLLKIW